MEPNNVYKRQNFVLPQNVETLIENILNISFLVSYLKLAFFFVKFAMRTFRIRSKTKWHLLCMGITPHLFIIDACE